MIDDHKTETLRYAYQQFIKYSCDQHRKWLQTSEVPEEDRACYDNMWRRLMKNGAETFFLEETEVPDDDVDVEIANFFIRVYARDGWTTFKPYFQILRVTWQNYKAMGLHIYFEDAESYSIRKK